MKTLPPAIVLAAKNGDADAIEHLLIECRPDAARFARSVCGHAEDAEDALQEALWIVQRHIGTLRVTAAFTGWLYQVIKYQCRRMRRSVGKTEPLSDAAAERLVATEQNILLRRDVSVAIAALRPEYRAAVLLRDVEQQTAPEAARQLGITVEALKSRLHRGRAELRIRLSAWNS